MMSRWLARRRALRTPLVGIRDVVDDAIVRVAGVTRVDGDRLLRAPVSERACLAYAVTVWIGLSRAHAGTEVAGVPFLLADGEHVARVEPTPVVLRMRDAVTHASDAGPTLSQRLLLERLGVIDAQWFDTMLVHYEETVVLPDHQVIVVGAATREVDPHGTSAGFRDGAMRVHLGGTRDLDVIITERRLRGSAHRS